MPSPLPLAPRGPLSGVSLLLVEDSRFASDATRLMCRHTGMRMRRAGSLETAWRHLSRDCPDVLIADVGLPDGCGLALIARLKALRTRPAVLLATSGDPGHRDAARQAGAQGFLEKPVASLARFQSAILAHLPEGDEERQPSLAACAAPARLEPDRLAYYDDLAAARRSFAALSRIRRRAEDPGVAYLSRFVRGVARSADDPDLERAARRLSRDARRGAPELVQLFDLVDARLRERPPI
ncbi:KDP operon transcriptional regulatory protein KdpE [Pseudoruegeria aquimaris]|uniref:KDP operon transcriptional regulatory protein KdpE n=1 Tax=Pseudoruegeria aquimaris TaxID=393663 RepID=A0A1Y5SQZ5_9RHOB|nr:response regulator [Pseudoruegeria aquimaris]SLN43259.1 KDP operon transcriptional regulatory protein KdpE [Pseudoruegeria aquimaris]